MDVTIYGLSFLKCRFTGYPRGLHTAPCCSVFSHPAVPIRRHLSPALSFHLNRAEFSKDLFVDLDYCSDCDALRYEWRRNPHKEQRGCVCVRVCVLSEGIICYHCGFNGSTQNPAHCALRPDTNSQKQTTQQQQGNKERKQDLKRLLAGLHANPVATASRIAF